jgi:hypothetical protein
MVDYDETSVTTPISRDHNYVHIDPFYGLSLSTSTDGGVTPASAFVQARAFAYDTGFAIAEVAQAEATIIFRPLVTNIVYTSYGPFGYSGLYDVTAGADILALGPFITPAAYNVSLNLDHFYSIYASITRRLPFGETTAPG